MTKTDTLFPFLNNIKTKLILINAVRKVPLRRVTLEVVVILCITAKGSNKNIGSLGGGTCPIAGFANGSTLRATAIYSEVGNVTDVIALT